MLLYFVRETSQATRKRIMPAAKSSTANAYPVFDVDPSMLYNKLKKP